MFKSIKNIDRIDLLCAFSIFTTVMVLQSILANIWAEKGIFDQYEIIFDSDPNEWLLFYSTGYGFESLQHPLANYIVSPFLRIIEKICSIFGMVEDSEAFKLTLSLYVAPFVTALKAVTFYTIFRLLNITWLQALLASAIAALAFSSVVFGATPESYPISGFAFALLILCAICVVMFDTKIAKFGLYATSILAIGATLSNVIFVGWTMWFINHRKGFSLFSSWYRAVFSSGIILIITIVMSLVAQKAVSELRSEEPINHDTNTLEFLASYVPPTKVKIEKFYRFPEMVAKSIIPTFPGHNPDSQVFKFDMPIKIEFSYLKNEYDIWSLIYTIMTIFLIGGGCKIAHQIEGNWKSLAVSSLAALGTYWAFYTWFGLSMFLYSQNWYVPSILLLASWLNKPTFSSTHGILLLSSVVIALTIANLITLNFINGQFA